MTVKTFKLIVFEKYKNFFLTCLFLLNKLSSIIIEWPHISFVGSITRKQIILSFREKIMVITASTPFSGKKYLFLFVSDVFL